MHVGKSGIRDRDETGHRTGIKQVLCLLNFRRRELSRVKRGCLLLISFVSD